MTEGTYYSYNITATISEGASLSKTFDVVLDRGVDLTMEEKTLLSNVIKQVLLKTHAPGVSNAVCSITINYVQKIIITDE